MIGKILAAAVAAYFVASAPAMAQVSVALSQKSTDASEIAAIAQSQGSVRVIVMFQPSTALASVASNASALDTVKAEVTQTQDAIIATYFGAADAPRDGANFPRSIRRFTITPGFAVNVNPAELNTLSTDGRVVKIQLDRADPPTLAQVLPLIGMPAAYTSGGTGTGTFVAVLDTGVLSSHEFLSGKVIAEACFSNSAGNPGNVSLCPNGTGSQTGTGAASPMVSACINGSNQLCEHGTHVAGIAAGLNTSVSTGEPTSGVGKSASIMAIQVFTRFNSDSFCGVGKSPCVASYNSDQISALDYVANHRTVSGSTAVAANMSLGGGLFASNCDSSDTARKTSIDTLRSLGVATVIASGNDGSKNAVSQPGCISTAVTVGSTTKTDVVSSFSNMSSLVDLLAPGGSASGGGCAFGANNNDILAPVPTAGGSTTTYACLAGTSMATPAVAGAFAAVKSACPAASIDAIESALKSTGITIADTRTGGTVSKPRIRVDLAINSLGCSGGTGAIAKVHDFDGNGTSDILWRNTSGDVGIWFMNGTITSAPIFGNLANTWSVVGQRDFDGGTTPKSDILWRNTAGDVLIWFMNGASYTQVSLGNVGTAWSVAGTGDFDGDGKGDILWRSTSNDIMIWFMNGSSHTTATYGNVGPTWSVVGTADFDGDGKRDILWRNSSNDIGIWFMNGTSVRSAPILGNVGPNWSVVGTGDFDGGGKGDILWRSSSNDIGIWFMNGATIAGAPILGNVGPNWLVASVGDYDGNGKSDILWRSSFDDIGIWFMNSTSPNTTTTISAPILDNVGTSWLVQNAASN